MVQVRDAFTCKYIREVFGEILNSLENGLKLEVAI